MTPLDRAYAKIEHDEQFRLQFYDCLSFSRLYVLLDDDGDQNKMNLRVFEVDNQHLVLAFDSEERLIDFTQSSVSNVEMSGRGLVNFLASAGLGLGLNLEVAPSSVLLPHTVMRWMSNRQAPVPDQTLAKPVKVASPYAVSHELLQVIDMRLANMAGQATMAYLAYVEYDNKSCSHVLAFVGVRKEFQYAITQTMAEAFSFLGMEINSLDIVFVGANDPICTKLAKHGLRFDLPELSSQVSDIPPKIDPQKPPILR